MKTMVEPGLLHASMATRTPRQARHGTPAIIDYDNDFLGTAQATPTTIVNSRFRAAGPAGAFNWRATNRCRGHQGVAVTSHIAYLALEPEPNPKTPRRPTQQPLSDIRNGFVEIERVGGLVVGRGCRSFYTLG